MQLHGVLSLEHRDRSGNFVMYNTRFSVALLTHLSLSTRHRGYYWPIFMKSRPVEWDGNGLRLSGEPVNRLMYLPPRLTIRSFQYYGETIPPIMHEDEKPEGFDTWFNNLIEIGGSVRS